MGFNFLGNPSGAGKPSSALRCLCIPETMWTASTPAWQEQNLLPYILQANPQKVRMGISWNMFEASQGVNNPTYVTNMGYTVDWLQSQGIEMLVVPAYSPGWANGGQASNIPPTNPAYFGDFLLSLISQWPNVAAWEIWNEPDLGYAWDQTPGPAATGQAYGEFFNAVYSQVKASAPNVKLCGPVKGTIDNGNGLTWTKAFLATNPTIDVITTHAYGDPPHHGNLTPNQLAAQWWANVGSVLAQQYPNTPQWLTETGWDTESGGVSYDQQAANLSGVFELFPSYSPMLERVYWFETVDNLSGDGGDYGLFDSSNNPKPSLAAFQAV